MPLSVRALGLGLLLSAVGVLLAADPPKPPAHADLVKQLGDRDFRTREEASKKLWELGEAARPALEAGLKSGSQEVVTRSKKILDKFNRGIFPDTPKELLALIDKFITSPEDANRFETARKLIALGPKGIVALEQQLRKGFGSDDERVGFFSQLQTHLRQVVPLLLFDGKEDEAETLLRLNSYGPMLPAHLDYAMFMARRGKGKELVEKMAEARALPGDVGKAAGIGLLCAYRVTNDRANLKALLGELTKGDRQFSGLREGMLLDIDDWATLADEPPESANSMDGLKAFRLRAAGKVKQADEVLAEVKSNDPAAVGGYSIEEGALALLLNGKTEDGIARLKASETAPHVLTDIQAVRLEFKEAMDVITAGLAAKPPKEMDEDDGRGFRLTSLYQAKKGRILAQLGKRDSAVQVFNQMTEGLNFYDNTAIMQLVKATHRSGFPDLAAEFLGRAQGKYDTDGNRRPFSAYSQDPYEIVFDADQEAAMFWWQVLRETRAKDEPGKRMMTVRKLLANKLPADEVKKLLEEGGRAKLLGPQGRNPNGGNAVSPFRKAMGVATAQRIAGDTAGAVATLLKAAEDQKKVGPRVGVIDVRALDDDPLDPSEPGGRQWVFGVSEAFRLWQDLGEYLVELKKPKEAAAALLDGWKQAPQNGLLLYYSGRALLQTNDAADTKEGKRRIALSHVVSLANARTRGRFLEELVNRGEPAEDVRAERDGTRATAWLPEDSNGNVWNQLGRASAQIKDFAGAVDASRRAIHYVLRNSGVTYVEGYAYVNVLATLRGFEARQLLAEGKPAEAMVAAREALVLLPTHTELVIGLVQGLDKANRKADADALFRQTWDAFAGVLKNHPDSAWARHQSAWLAAGCRRELDTALTHAKKAVELEPDSKSHRSGLAEVSFRKGDREKAVELMTKLTTEDRRNHFFRRQLERYKTAPFDAPLPDNDDD